MRYNNKKKIVKVPQICISSPLKRHKKNVVIVVQYKYFIYNNNVHNKIDKFAFDIYSCIYIYLYIYVLLCVCLY